MSHMDHSYPTSADLADTIKAAAKAAHISQRELAELTRIPLTTLNRKLNSAPLDWHELTSIARVLGRSASGLIAETEVRVAAAEHASTTEVA